MEEISLPIRARGNLRCYVSPRTTTRLRRVPCPCKLFPVVRVVNETELPLLTYSKYAGLKGSGTKVTEAGNLSHSTGDTYFRDQLKTNLQQMSSQLSLMLQVAKVGSEVT